VFVFGEFVDLGVMRFILFVFVLVVFGCIWLFSGFVVCDVLC